jgi:hypothetical protein
MVIWLGIAVIALFTLVACSGEFPDKEYECIGCKRQFKYSEKTTIDTYDMGDEFVIKDACPFCKSDLIIEKEASE